jgi:tetratricopeptide (TPR) repeat protein
MEIIFGILGQTTMRMHGRMTVNWGNPRSRRILAALLTQPGRRVPIETLLEWAWHDDEQTPRHPGATLSNNAKLIRSAFRAAQAPAQLTAAGGAYRLEIDPRLIDYFAFRTAVDQAREHDRHGRHLQSRDAVSAGLALWHEDPLSDLATERARNWRRSVIDNDWLPANTLLLGEHIALGDADAALRRLDELQRDHPAELNLVKIRIRALRLLSRYQDATEYFRAARKKLLHDGDHHAADELLAFHDQLAHAAALPTVLARPKPPPAGHEDSPSPPSQLPRDIRDFAGRDDILSALDEASGVAAGQPHPSVVALAGQPGVGKTTTTVRWAHRSTTHFPHGTLFLDLRGVGAAPRMEASDAVDVFLAALGYPADQIVGPAGRAAKLRSLLAQRPMLVVLDNAADSEHVDPLLGVLDQCVVVVTSRQRLTALAVRHGVPIVTVSPLPTAESAQMLARRIGTRSRHEPEALSDLAHLCGGLPLALNLVAERAASRTAAKLSTMVTQLRDHDLLLHIGDDGDGISLSQAFTLSYRGLGSSEAGLFRRLGIHPGTEVSIAALAAISGMPASDTRRAVDVLMSAHLVQQPADIDRYRIHDLLHHYATALAASDEGAEQAQRQMLSFYLHSAHNAHLIVYPQRVRPPMLPVEDGCTPLEFQDATSALRWCLQERSNLRAAIEYAAQHGFLEYCWTLPHVTVDLWDRYGFYEDIITVLTVAARAAAELGDHGAEAATLNDLGQVHLIIGEYDKTDHFLQRALEISESHGIELGTLTVMLNMARRHHHVGQLTDAVGLYRHCLELAHAAADRERYAGAAHRLGDALVDLGEDTSALEQYQSALRIRVDIGDIDGQVSTCTALGALFTRRGHHAEADAQCRRAAELLDQVSNLAATMKLYTVLAQLAHAQRRDREALRYAQDAVELADRSHSATGKARALATLGHILADRGNLDDARDIWQQAIRLYRDRSRHTKADALLAILTEHEARSTIPATRTPEDDTVALPAPPPSSWHSRQSP